MASRSCSRSTARCWSRAATTASCPRSERWQELHGLMPPARRPRRAEAAGAADRPGWAKTAPLTKRLLFREHIEWAEAQGVLENVMSFMQTMPEADWLHMGED
jgi:hypothetical protein